jgi:hypothetical protein
MKSFFQRRKHQKLKELSDEALELTQRHSDVSSSSDSFVSFDPNSFTREELLRSPMIEIGAFVFSDFPIDSTPDSDTSRRCWTPGWPTKKQRHHLSSREGSFSNKAFNESEKLRRELADLNTFEIQLRSQSKVKGRENQVGRSDVVKSTRRSSNSNEKEGSANRSKLPPREATWRRRVSSLEAFFQNETTTRSSKYKDQSLESDIKKVVSFDKRVGDELSPMSKSKKYGSHGSSLRSSKKKNDSRKPKSFGETIEQSMSGVLGEITSKGEEILDSVPDWSVGSSSVDQYMSATSDDEDTSFSGFPSRQQFSWNGVDKSSSSGEDEDDEDYISQAGCNSVQSCDIFTSEIGTLLQEMLPRDTSDLYCFSQSDNSGQRRRRKRTI